MKLNDGDKKYFKRNNKFFRNLSNKHMCAL